MAVATYTKAGARATTPAKLDKKVFGLEVAGHQLLKDAYLAYLANGRTNSAKTKTRGQVRGGGKKPWRQKGTGRARFGSSRNPIWEGGGVAFGPTGNENYTRNLNLKSKRLALRQALSLAAAEDRVKIIDDFVGAGGKAKSANSLMTKLGASGSVLLAVDDKTPETDRATRNLSGVKLISAKYLNVYDIMNADSLVITKKALEVIHQWLGTSASQTAKPATGEQK